MMKIINRITHRTIFKVKEPAWELETLVREAVSRGKKLIQADLRGLTISNHDFFMADFSLADLSVYSRFRKVSFKRCQFKRAILKDAAFSKCDLSVADFSFADLTDCLFNECYLTGTNFYKANLTGVTFQDCTFSSSTSFLSADIKRIDVTPISAENQQILVLRLSQARNFHPEMFDMLRLLQYQKGKVRLFKLVTDNDTGIYMSGKTSLTYTNGKTVKVNKYNTNCRIECAKGIHLATLDWCYKHFEEGYKIKVCEFDVKDIVAIPYGGEGKIRVRKCKVLYSLNLKKLGLK